MATRGSFSQDPRKLIVSILLIPLSRTWIHAKACSSWLLTHRGFDDILGTSSAEISENNVKISNSTSLPKVKGKDFFCIIQTSDAVLVQCSSCQVAPNLIILVLL